MRRDQGAGDLSVIGMDEDSIVHDVISSVVGADSQPTDSLAGAVAGKDGSGEAEFRQGQLYDRLGDHSRARECHARALQINPTHAGASASLKPTGT